MFGILVGQVTVMLRLPLLLLLVNSLVDFVVVISVLIVVAGVGVGWWLRKIVVDVVVSVVS